MTEPEPATTSSPNTYSTLPSKIILTSTKSYFSPQRTIKYLEDILRILPVHHHPDLLFGLIPDFLTIHPCALILSQLTTHNSPTSRPTDPSRWPLRLGAQDCSPFSHGAYTGFIVPPALSSLGVTIVELGHAERRKLVGENDELVAAKAAAVCKEYMIPLVCIGEIEAPNLNGPMSAAVGTAMRQLTPQITSMLEAVPDEAPVIFAYEPVWAIGAPKPAGVDYVGPVVEAIREVVKKSGRSGQTKVVYGGSAGPGLWSGATNGGNGLGQWVDGMFLGRFAHEIAGVEKVLKEVIETLPKQ